MTNSPTNRGAVVITGASRGIGRTLALDLSANGFDVFAGVRKEADGEALKERSDGHITPVHLEVTDDDSIRSAADQIAKATDGAGIAGIVNNAAVFSMGPVEQCPLSDIEYDFGVNVFGAIAVIQHFMPQLRARSGRIVNISSVNGELSTPFAGVYSATKFALEAISDAMRVELRPWNIHVSVVQPGAVATDIRIGGVDKWDVLRSNMPEEERGRYSAMFETTAALINNFNESAAGHEYVSEAVLDALTADSPKTRYQAGPDWPQFQQLIDLDDEARDEALAGMFGL